MKYIKHIAPVLILWTLTGLHEVRGQVTIQNNSEYEVLRATPMETIYAHTSATLLFPGEYLYFSLYCINMQSFRLSTVSSVAYVQLTGEDGNVYLRKKVRLKGGRGQGDLFIGTDIPSGAYKLVAYTNWMRNAGTGQVFMGNVTVLNPYQQDQSALLGGDSAASDPATEDFAGQGARNPDKPETAEVIESRVGVEGLLLETDTRVYGLRDWATLSLRNFRSARGYGHYSISVERVPDLPAVPDVTAEDYSARYPNLSTQIPQGVGDQVAIPEQRGELIGGQLLTGPEDTPVPGVWVGLSFPGQNFQLKMARTDASGRFFTYLVSPYSGSRWVARVLDSEVRDYTIREFSAWEKFNPDNFRAIAIDTSMSGAILRRSIHNQITNSYYEVTPDTVVAPVEEDPYFGEIPQDYILDEFTRFPTLRETLVEIVQHVWIRREPDGSRTFWVRAPMDPAGSEYTENPPLVTVDGVLVPDHQSLLDFDARQIRRIRVLREKKLLENREYQGMVVIETIAGDYAENGTSAASQQFSYQPPAPVRQYYRQGTGLSNLPDFRYQLLWEPHIDLEGPLREFRFRTSDVPGTYRVRLEGYTTYGKPISLTGFLEVSGNR